MNIRLLALMSVLSLLSLGEETQSGKGTKEKTLGDVVPGVQQATDKKSGRRARPPRERRREGAIHGLVAMPYGKTASGERTHLYRIMGQGGVVADFTDYGARLVRLYAPDATLDLANVIEGFRPSAIACEKAGDVAEVWKMTPIRRPRATGLMFEIPSSRITCWLDAANRLTIESTITDTNAVKWASSLAIAPLKGRRLEIADSFGERSFANTTNTVSIALRPGTNATEKVSIRFAF